jgi:diguanylate cyclase (GGDEF)-like protein
MFLAENLFDFSFFPTENAKLFKVFLQRAMKIHLPIQKKLFFSHFLAVLLVSGSIGTFFYLSAVDSLIRNLQDRLKYSAALISQTIDAGRLENIRKQSDNSLPEYREYLSLLRAFRKTNPDIAYLYIMRKENNRIFFVIDSDETDQQALPGQEYLPDVPTLREGFSGPSVDKQIYTDQWGSTMSGYSPLRNGNGRYLVGVDMRATEVRNKLHNLRISGIISLFFSVLLALIFSRLLSSHFNTPIQLLVSRCVAIAKGKLGERLDFRAGDELDNLIDAFNDMSANLHDSQEKNRLGEEALRKSRDELEVRVDERTKELVNLNKELVQEVAERKQAEERLAQAATSDPLTGLMNRRAMLDQLKYQAIRYRRSNTPFVILLIDLDHFKNINDAYGHDAGDEALVAVAGCLRNSTRSQDLISRWGGEEFMVLLPDTDLKGGLAAAEKIRSNVARKSFTAGGINLELTLSAGVAAYSAEQTLDDCIKAADTALYQAKNEGRNRVSAFDKKETNL